MKKSSLYPLNRKRKNSQIIDVDVVTTKMKHMDIKNDEFKVFREIPNNNNNFVPISDYESYLENKMYVEKKQVNSYDQITEKEKKIKLQYIDRNIENIRQKHIDYYNLYPKKVVPVKEKSINRTQYVAAKLSVNKSGNVRLKTRVPMQELYDKYPNRGIIPIEERIKAMNEVHYSMDEMKVAIENNDKKTKWQVDANKVFDRVFEKYGKSKSSKPSKKVSAMAKLCKAFEKSRITIENDTAH